VADTIIDTLLMDRDYFLKITHPFNRANLFYEVRYVKQGAADDRLDDIADFIRKQYRRHAEKAGSDQDALPVSGIVYARAKATCDGIADFLKRKGIRAAT
jgi:bloom syndrome protein